jgi:hypothetical protein
VQFIENKKAVKTTTPFFQTSKTVEMALTIYRRGARQRGNTMNRAMAYFERINRGKKPKPQPSGVAK